MRLALSGTRHRTGSRCILIPVNAALPPGNTRMGHVTNNFCKTCCKVACSG
jgi:hypothetical protein